MDQAHHNNCTELSVHQYETLALVRGLTGLGCGLISLIILLFMVGGMIKSKFTKGSLEWIVVYLAALVIMDNVLFLFLMLPSLSQWFGFCRALGVALELVNWVQQGCTLALAFHQLSMLYKLVQRVRNPYASLTQKTEVKKRGVLTKKCHYCALLLVWVPVLLNVVWLPFEAEDEFQEVEPEWCWIVSITDDCEKDGLEFVEELVLWYIPIAVVSLTITCTTIATLVVWIYTCCKKHYKRDEIISENYRPINLLSLIVYTLFTLLCIIEIAVRTYTVTYRKHNYIMWMTFAIAIPLRDLLLPICYSMQVYFYRMHHRNLPVPSEVMINASGSVGNFNPTNDD